MKKIDHSKLTAKPETEDFSGKYEDSGFIAKYLVNNYFKAVEKLLSKTHNVTSAHEIGAGEGLSTLRLNKMVENLSASEYVEDLVNIAKKNNPKINVFQESVYQLKHKNSSVDLVFLLEFLEHLYYPELALEELERVSNKYLILGVPRETLWRFLNICRLKYLNDLGNTPGHLNHWSKKSIIRLIEKKYGQIIAVKSVIPWTIILAEKRNN